MSATDRTTEAESLHLLAAIHDELRAIRGVAPTPKEPEPLADWERDLLLAGSPHTETERLLAAECDRLREERDRARREAEALAEQVDGLRSEKAVDLDTIARVREERDQARTRIISLTGDLEAARCERDDQMETIARWLDDRAEAEEAGR